MNIYFLSNEHFGFFFIFFSLIGATVLIFMIKYLNYKLNISNFFSLIFKSFLRIKLHQLFFGIIIVICVCLIRHALLIHALDLPENIFLAIMCFFSRLLFIDLLKDLLDKWEFNPDMGQIFWGRQYLGGGDTNITSHKSTQFKQVDKLFMADNNPERPSTSSGNKIKLPPPNIARSPVQTTPSAYSIFGLNSGSVRPTGSERFGAGVNLAPIRPGSSSNGVALPSIVRILPSIGPITSNNPVVAPVPSNVVTPAVEPITSNNNPVVPRQPTQGILASQQVFPGTPGMALTEFRTAKGGIFNVLQNGEFRVDRNINSFYCDFNNAYSIYGRFPTETIMADYDELIAVLPSNISSSAKFHNYMTDRSLCVLKMAASYDNILSDNSKSILKGFGHGSPILHSITDTPSNLNNPNRIQIRDELVRNRAVMLAILNARS